MPFKGFFHPKESKRKMSNSQKGRKHSEETKLKMSKWHKGRKFSKEHCENMSKVRIGKPLSEETKRKMKGRKSSNWKGGRQKRLDGYVTIHQPTHPFCIRNSYVYEHRLVMEKHLGRYLKPEEVVHHINGMPDDNRLENLQLFKNNSEHMKFHTLIHSVWNKGKHHSEKTKKKISITKRINYLKKHLCKPPN